MKIIQILLFSMLLICFRVSGQEVVVAKFSVEPGRLRQGRTPICASLEGIDYNTDKGALRLFELKGKMRAEVSCQLEAGNSPKLWWIPECEFSAKVSRKFILIKDSTFVAKNVITIELSAKDLIICQNKQKMMQYNVSEVFPPDTISSIYRRSAFLHPLWSPSGHILTRINAPDHWHHLGIWNIGSYGGVKVWL